MTDARVLRDGVRGRRRPDDAHPRGRVHGAARRVLRGVRRARPPVPAREPHHLQVGARQGPVNHARSLSTLAVLYQQGLEAGQPAARHGGLREDRRLRPVQGGHGLRRPDGHVLRHARVPRARGAHRADVHARRRLVGPRRAHLRDARRRVALPRRRRGGGVRQHRQRRSALPALLVARGDRHHAQGESLRRVFSFERRPSEPSARLFAQSLFAFAPVLISRALMALLYGRVFLRRPLRSGVDLKRERDRD